MKPDLIKDILERLSCGTITADEAYQRLKHLPFEDLGFATIDHHRTLRRGYPEVIFCERKRPEEVAAIVERMRGVGSDVLGTRCAPEAFEAVRAVAPEAEYHDRPRLFRIRGGGEPPAAEGSVLLVAAGTSDLAVLEEARLTAEFLGLEVRSLVDVGVAGLHRLLSHEEALAASDVIVVIAGMEGALASVVGGLVDAPIVAVPTSVGYGSSFEGLAALLAMLNSCASGVTVVNIDNGFGAAYAAAMICGRGRRGRAGSGGG